MNDGWMDACVPASVCVNWNEKRQYKTRRGRDLDEIMARTGTGMVWVGKTWMGMVWYVWDRDGMGGTARD